MKERDVLGRTVLRRILTGAATVFAVSCNTGVRPTPPITEDVPAAAPVAAGAADVGPANVELANEAAFFDDAAAVAFRQFNSLWQPRTGLAAATRDYQRLTPWDLGSVIAANYSAHRLGLLNDVDYKTRMTTTLRTLQTMPLYRGAVFHKSYMAQTAQMANKKGQPTKVGFGWSATDLGRLLIWLQIVGQNDAQFRPAVDRIVRRLNLQQAVTDGYMYGGLMGNHGKLWRFQEGRIGYEQYSAQGFRFWGADVHNALDVHTNAQPVDVWGVNVMGGDKRGLDRLNSEPFVLFGMELGLPPAMDTLARQVLAAQEMRFQKTQRLTMVSEDAINLPPYYFYYYCVICNGRTFTVDVAETGKELDKPRWVSTKASFGYHALLHTPYTKRVLESVATAKTPQGWSSGVFEETNEPTRTYDINTAAVVLEAALYRKLGQPLLRSSLQ